MSKSISYCSRVLKIIMISCGSTNRWRDACGNISLIVPSCWKWEAEKRVGTIAIGIFVCKGLYPLYLVFVNTCTYIHRIFLEKHATWKRPNIKPRQKIMLKMILWVHGPLRGCIYRNQPHSPISPKLRSWEMARYPYVCSIVPCTGL